MTNHETKLQKLTRDAVIADGGNATILSNRFLVGVADMAIKTREMPSGPALVEVKQREYPKTNLMFKLDITPLQLIFLRQWDKAGAQTAILSFLRGPDKRLYAALLEPPRGGWKPAEDVFVERDAHFAIDAKCAGVVPLLTAHFRGAMK